jgi:alpha-ribazole phosphatase
MEITLKNNYNNILVDLTLIRHGQVQANIEKRYIGSTDMSLTVNGMKSLEKLNKAQIYKTPDYLFCSPMSRCKMTCDILFPDKIYTVIDEFHEMDFGSFEMKNYQELKDNAYYQRWIDSNGTIAFPEGESRQEFVLRCMSGFDKMLSKTCCCVESDSIRLINSPLKITIDNKNDNVYIKNNNQVLKMISITAVVHGGTIMAILSSLNKDEYYNYQCKNAEGYICRFII